jgi:hypothetical protein
MPGARGMGEGVILDYRECNPGLQGGVILDDTFNLFLRTTTKNQPPIVPQGGRPAGGLADGFNSRAEIEIDLLKLDARDWPWLY